MSDLHAATIRVELVFRDPNADSRRAQRRTTIVSQERDTFQQECDAVKPECGVVRQERDSFKEGCDTVKQKYDEIEQEMGEARKERNAIKQELDEAKKMTQANAWEELTDSTSDGYSHGDDNDDDDDDAIFEAGQAQGEYQDDLEHYSEDVDDKQYQDDFQGQSGEEMMASLSMIDKPTVENEKPKEAIDSHWLKIVFRAPFVSSRVKSGNPRDETR